MLPVIKWRACLSAMLELIPVTGGIGEEHNTMKEPLVGSMAAFIAAGSKA
jgi:hypothetical protein